MKLFRRGLGLVGSGALFWLLLERSAIAHPVALHQLEALLQNSHAAPSLVLSGLGLAFGLGTMHALSPGHGKTMVAAYLVGSRGTPQQALGLGLITTVTHTAGVFALGLIALIAAQYGISEQIYPILSLLSGLVVCWVGVELFISRMRSLNSTHSVSEHFHAHPDSHSNSHSHPPDHSHDHSHTHPHSTHAHAHHHAEELAQVSDWRSLIALGIAGGLVPCPSALVLMLSAIALNQTTYGLMLVGGFSLGLASVLTGLGLVAVYAQQWLNRLPSAGTALRYFSLVSAAVIVVVGMSLTLYSVI